MERLQRVRPQMLAGAAGLAALGYVYLQDPNVPGHYPPCPTKVLTGLDCPFCGGLRATYAALHGDVAGSLDHNALVLLLILPLGAALFVLWTVSALWPARFRQLSWPGWATAALTVLLVAFTVVRNLPGSPLNSA